MRYLVLIAVLLAACGEGVHPAQVCPDACAQLGPRGTYSVGELVDGPNGLKVCGPVTRPECAP